MLLIFTVTIRTIVYTLSDPVSYSPLTILMIYSILLMTDSSRLNCMLKETGCVFIGFNWIFLQYIHFYQEVDVVFDSLFASSQYSCPNPFQYERFLYRLFQNVYNICYYANMVERWIEYGYCFCNWCRRYYLGYSQQLFKIIDFNINIAQVHIMGCTINATKKNNHAIQQMFEQALESTKPNRIITTENFNYLSTQVKKRLNKKFSFDYRFREESDLFGMRCQLMILCRESLHYEKGVYGRQKQYFHQVYKQIQQDVKRTFPEQAFFQNEDNIYILERVLKNIALYFPEQGYTQGINFIVGFLLLSGIPQEQAFWSFINMASSEKYMLMGMFQDGFPLTDLYYFVFQQLFKKYFRSLYDKCEKIGLPKEAWIFQWFITYFLYSFPLELAKLLWSFIIVNNGLSVVYLALGIINQLYQELMHLDNEDIAFCHYFTQLKNPVYLYMHLKVEKVFQFAKRIQLNLLELSQILKGYKNKTIYSELYSNISYPDRIQHLKLKYLNKLQQSRKQFIQESQLKERITDNQEKKIRINLGQRFSKKIQLQSQSLMFQSNQLLLDPINYSFSHKPQSTAIEQVGSSNQCLSILHNITKYPHQKDNFYFQY